MCKMKAERLIKEILMRNHCRFLTSKLEDDILIVWFIDVTGECVKSFFPYRYMNEKEIEDMVIRSIY